MDSTDYSEDYVQCQHCGEYKPHYVNGICRSCYLARYNCSTCWNRDCCNCPASSMQNSY